MDFRTCIEQQKIVLMEGALSARLKREYCLTFDPAVAMARLIYSEAGGTDDRHIEHLARKLTQA